MTAPRDRVRPARTSRSHATRLAPALLLALATGACNDDTSSDTAEAALGRGTVTTSWGEPVVGARVYFVPADAVATNAITASGVLSGAAEAFDEPLEDLVPGPVAASFAQAVTDGQGGFSVQVPDPAATYYPYVDTVGATPAGLFPGGDMSRSARAGSALSDLVIELTGGPSPAASFVGSSRCLQCHVDFSSQKVHAHRFGLRKPGVSTQLQDTSRHPSFDDGLAFFKAATSANFKSLGTTLWYFDFDATRGFDKFKIATSDPAPGTVKLKVYLWRDTGDASKPKVTMENVATPSDPDRTYEVDLTYGGAVHKQRYLLKVPGRKGRYPFLQYQTQGNNSYYERTRKAWRDYNAGTFWDATADLLTVPSPSKTFESECLACHATGYRTFLDPVTGERLADAVDDASGDVDIDDDGTQDEINTGCEVCHGPGSEHVTSQTPRSIIKPQNLSPERENMLCGRCHDRPLGNDDRRNDQPLSMSEQFAPPGIKRSVWLADYTSRKGPGPGDYWLDQMHSSSHHQQYSDFLKSAHYRNDRRLVVCSDCHDLHGKGAHDGELKGNPADGTLCARCHVVNIPDHLVEYTGSQKAGKATECTNCHYYKTAKSGAGTREMLLGVPTGAATDEALTYWQNDISSHLTTVPRKTNPSVLGKPAGRAMPVPYVNKCGTCHDARFLQYQDR